MSENTHKYDEFESPSNTDDKYGKYGNRDTGSHHRVAVGLGRRRGRREQR